MKIRFSGIIWIVTLSIAFLVSDDIQGAWHLNSLNISLLKSDGPVEPGATPDCSHQWMVGLTQGRHGDLTAQYEAFIQALYCSPDSISIIQAALPEDNEMAGLAERMYPESAKAWFWLGESIASTDKLAAREAYLRTVELAPQHRYAWCRLGKDFERTKEVERAEESYLNCCLLGDDGSHGCYGAGRMAEQQGNLQQAIKYYRLSNWSGALNRADELEVQLAPDR